MTTIPTRMVRRHGIALLVSSALLFLMAYATHANADPGRASLERQILGLLREGNTEEALPLCRDYAEKYPGDALMLYNLACLENGAGNEERAADAFGRAIAAGFEDFDHALKDPDLAGVDAVPGLIETETARLAALTVARAPVLAYGAWSPDLPLTDRTSLSGAELSGLSDPVLRLGWQPTGLDIEVNAAEDWAGMGSGEALSPANGGSGLFLSLSIPDGRSPFTSANHFLFAFGVEKGAGIGAMFIPEQQRWQRIQELDPKIRMDDAGRYNLVAFLPWQAVMPFHPLVDAPLGINAGLFMGGAAGPVMASLLQAQDLRDPTAVTRRFVPVEFDAASVPGDVFLGRVSNSISTDDPLAVELAVLAGSPGPGTLTFDFLDGFGRSVLPTGAFSERIDLAAGPNRLTRQADFRPSRPAATCCAPRWPSPRAHTAQWGTSILHLATGWDGRLAARIEILPPGETATAAILPRHGQGRPWPDHPIAPEPQGHRPDADRPRHPAGQCRGRRHDPAGQGRVPDGLSGSGRRPRLCQPLPARRPGNWPTGSTRFSSSPPRRAPRADRRPHGPELRKRRPETDDQGRGSGRISHLSGTSARVAGQPGASRPGGRNRRLSGPGSWTYFEPEVFGGRRRRAPGPRPAAVRPPSPGGEGHDDLRRAQPGTLAPGRTSNSSGSSWADCRRAAGRPGLDFIRETSPAGQGPSILRGPAGLGANIVEMQKVRGGLNFTQAADRTVLWAEGLR